MNRTIFLRELRVGLRQELVAAGFVLASFATGGWLAVSVFDQSIREVRGVLSTFIAISIHFLAFSSGARTFTAESRRRQELFLNILPISRTSLWLSIVGGRLAAALSMAVLLLLADFFLSGNPPALLAIQALGLTLYPFLFASGICLSPLFRRDLACYLTGILILPSVPVQVASFLGSSSPDSLISPALIGLLSLAFFLVSWLFFQRGESQTLARQLTNLMFLSSTLAMSLLIIGIVTLSPLLDRVAGPWTQDLEPQAPFNWTTASSPLASPNGRYLAVVETLRKRPGVSRVTIVETATGRRIGVHRWRGFGQVSWGAQNEVLRILRRDTAIPFIWRGPGKSEWSWLSPEGSELARHSPGQIQDALPLRDGSYLLLDTSLRARLLRWESPEGLRVLAEIPQAGPIYKWGDQGAIVIQQSDTATQVAHVKDGKIHAVSDMEAFLKFYRSFLSDIEKKSGRKLLSDIGKERLFEKPAFGGVSLPDKLALYLPMSGSGTRLHLHDGSLGREIPLPPCSSGQAAAPELFPTHNSSALLIRYQCRYGGTSDQAVQFRHFYYLPGSGSPKAFTALDQILDSAPIILAYLDERTAIWRPEKGETWKILRDGQIRTLWPPQNSELSQ